MSETERRYEEAARKLLITETDLEKAEERADGAEAKLKALTVELNQVSNELRTLNARYHHADASPHVRDDSLQRGQGACQ